MKRDTSMWKCKDGSKVRICDMTDAHLINTIKLLRRKAREFADNAAFSIPMFQGEMAQMHAEQECDRLLQAENGDLADELTPFYEKLIVEADKRKLEIED